MHPAAIRSIEAWLATLPEEVQRDSAPLGTSHSTWKRLHETSWPPGVSGPIAWIRTNSGDVGRGDYHFPDNGAALVRQIRRAALVEISEHEPTDDEVGAENKRLREHAWQMKAYLPDQFYWWIRDGRKALARRRRAAQRLLFADELAELRDVSTLGAGGWATHTEPARTDCNATLERIEAAEREVG